MTDLTEAKRAAALADPTKIAFDGLARIARMVDSEKQGELASITLDKMDAAIRALAARPAIQPVSPEGETDAEYERRQILNLVASAERYGGISITDPTALRRVISILVAYANRPSTSADLREVVLNGIASVQMPGVFRQPGSYYTTGELRVVSDAVLSSISAAGYEMVPAGTTAALRGVMPFVPLGFATTSRSGASNDRNTAVQEARSAVTLPTEAEIRADERERCAQIAERMEHRLAGVWTDAGFCVGPNAPHAIAEAIRSADAGRAALEAEQ